MSSGARTTTESRGGVTIEPGLEIKKGREAIKEGKKIARQLGTQMGDCWSETVNNLKRTNLKNGTDTRANT